MAQTGQIYRLDLPNNKASLVDLSTGIRYVFARSEMADPTTIKRHDIVTFTVSGDTATSVAFRSRPRGETVISLNE